MSCCSPVTTRYLLNTSQRLRKPVRAMVVTRASSAAWRDNIVTSTEEIHKVCLDAKRIAVLGIKTEEKPEQPAFHVPEYLDSVGKEIIPVPVYYPDVTKILGKLVFRKVADIPGGPVDIVDVFRKPSDVPGHLEDLIKAKPRCVWLQLGIRNDEAAETLAKEGIKVVQDKCLLVEHMAAVEASKKGSAKPVRRGNKPAL